MSERIFVQGNEAVGWGALMADCRAFFGYPITPQNEIPEWFAREFPKRGRIYVQSQCETAAICMVYGAAAAGIRAMTSTSGPGYSLMLEMLSGLYAAQIPCVLVLVQREGPGAGPIRHAQMDYLSTVWGGGHGGYRTIVLAPASVQETHDLVQLAFYLADKYRIPVIVLTDGVLGLLAEPLEVKTLDFGPLPEKSWALKGKGRHEDGQARAVFHGVGWGPMYVEGLKALEEKKRQIKEAEVRYEVYRGEDAELFLVAYGYAARVSKEAVNLARAEGWRVGLIRPITLWPFPQEVIREKALRGCRFAVVEDSMGQMVEDVKLAVEGRSPVHLLGTPLRFPPAEGGKLLPERVLEEVKRLL